MVGAKFCFHEMEIYWSKFPLMDSWKTLVFRTLALSLELIIFGCIAGAGKSVLWYVNLSIFSLLDLIISYPIAPQSFRISTQWPHRD